MAKRKPTAKQLEHQHEVQRLRKQLKGYEHKGFVLDIDKALSRKTTQQLKELKPKDILLKSASYVSEGTYGEVITAKQFYSNRRAILDAILEQQTQQQIAQLEDFDIGEYNRQQIEAQQHSKEMTPEERQEAKQEYRDYKAWLSKERILKRKQGRKVMDFTDTYSTMVYNWLGSIDMLPPKVRNIVYKHWKKFVDNHGYSKSVEMVAHAIENNEIPDFEWLKNQPSDVVEQEVSDTFDMFLQYLGVDNDARIAINDELDGNGNDWSRAEDNPFE